MISSLPPMAPQGVPPAIALPRVTMSGTTPQRSTAPPRAVQMPTLTSSKMSTMPCFLVSARTPSRKPGSGSTTPRFIIAASMMTQAGGLPSSTMRSMRLVMFSRSLNGTGMVMSIELCGMPPP